MEGRTYISLSLVLLKRKRKRLSTALFQYDRCFVKAQSLSLSFLSFFLRNSVNVPHICFGQRHWMNASFAYLRVEEGTKSDGTTAAR